MYDYTTIKELGIPLVTSHVALEPRFLFGMEGTPTPWADEEAIVSMLEITVLIHKGDVTDHTLDGDQVHPVHVSFQVKGIPETFLPTMRTTEPLEGITSNVRNALRLTMIRLH